MEETSRLKQTQEAAEEVKVIMIQNMDKADEREEKLTDLDQRANQLLTKSKSFSKRAKTIKVVKKKENRRSKLVLVAVGAGVFVLLFIIIVVIAARASGGASTSNAHERGITTAPTTHG